ncbi:hypothetical protein B0J12DRAFT_687639 [Macrophomina phaseolina]|uniref:Uncharacterized protein n=1 Tax=Macrophomina phaseolina TaxID=35725 RepID=A0ABQ8FT68_9PEZI|nr:hypothetical protein B0J12DRAFT_687639 [Macrophomina phaseolina]
MSSITDTHYLDPSGKVWLILFPVAPKGDYEDNDLTFSDFTTSVEDAESIGTLTADNRFDEAAAWSHLQTSTTRSGNERTTSQVTRFLASYLSLQRSSQVFRSILERKIDALRVDPASDYIYIPLTGDDPTALTVVLQALHDCTQPFDSDRKDIETIIPNEREDNAHIELSTLARVATIVEKYDLHATLERQIIDWFRDVWNSMEKASVDDAIAWVWITWIFDLDAYFQEASECLAKMTVGPLASIHELIFEIPQAILKDIDRQRWDALQEIYALYTGILHPLQDIGTDPEYSPESPSSRASRPETETHIIVPDAFFLGLLLIEGRHMRMYPAPDPSFNGISYATTVEIIRRMPDPSNYTVLHLDENDSEPKKSLKTLVDCLDNRQWGTMMEDYKDIRRRVKSSY